MLCPDTVAAWSSLSEAPFVGFPRGDEVLPAPVSAGTQGGDTKAGPFQCRQDYLCRVLLKGPFPEVGMCIPGLLDTLLLMGVH